MTPFDHLQQFARIFNRAIAELPASQRQVFADLATPHGDALAKELGARTSGPLEPSTSGPEARAPGDRTQEHG